MKNEEARGYSERVMAELKGLADVALPDRLDAARQACRGALIELDAGDRAMVIVALMAEIIERRCDDAPPDESKAFGKP